VRRIVIGECPPTTRADAVGARMDRINSEVKPPMQRTDFLPNKLYTDEMVVFVYK